MEALAPARLGTVSVSRRMLALWLCAGSAFFEGFDNQALGVAAPKLFPAFHLAAAQGSLLFSATTAGLAIGAVLGGRLADRYGRKQTLGVSMALFGAFSLLTAASRSFEMLLAARLLTGLGLGGSMPNAIAIAANAASMRRRLMVVALVTAFLPFGGAISGLLGLGMDSGWSWRLIFYVGGIVPLLLLAPLWRWLPSHEISAPPPESGQEALSGASTKASAGATANAPTTASGSASAGAAVYAPRLESFAKVLFGPGRAVTTVLLWIGFFFLHMVLFLLLNWLPSLFIGLGFSRAQGSWSAFWFNICGAIAGVLLAARQGERTSARARWSVICYLGMAAALAALAFSRSFAVAAVMVALSGTFVIGGQLVLYAMAPLYYPRDSRSTGVGTALTLARFGSVLGPLFAGALLALGATSSTVLLGVLPFVAASGAAVWLLAARRYLA